MTHQNSQPRLGNFFSMICWLSLACTTCFATTKGLNQIVTPDIQPLGVLSTSVQVQNPALGNSDEVQLELGITKNFEVAVFQGCVPGEVVLNAEYGLIQQKSFLLSTGVLGIENGHNPQPFLEGGWYHDKVFGIAGVQQQHANAEGVFGFGYQATPAALVTLDYITGDDNFATAGVTFTLTPNLSFNPALYISNKTHTSYGYGVLSWNAKLW